MKYTLSPEIKVTKVALECLYDPSKKYGGIYQPF